MSVHHENNTSEKMEKLKKAASQVNSVLVFYNTAKDAYQHALHNCKGRWPAAEELIAEFPSIAVDYAQNIIKGRWERIEPLLKKHPSSLCKYAVHVMKGNWEEGEELLKEDGTYWEVYQAGLRDLAREAEAAEITESTSS